MFTCKCVCVCVCSCAYAFNCVCVCMTCVLVSFPAARCGDICIKSWFCTISNLHRFILGSCNHLPWFVLDHMMVHKTKKMLQCHQTLFPRRGWGLGTRLCVFGPLGLLYSFVCEHVWCMCICACVYYALMLVFVFVSVSKSPLLVWVYVYGCNLVFLII